MKKLIIRMSTACILLSFATFSLPNVYGNSNLINNTEEKIMCASEFAKEVCEEETNTFSVEELSEIEKQTLFCKDESDDAYEINIEDAYCIEKKVDDNTFEKTIVGDVRISNKSNMTKSSSITESKEGRVTISCTLGYERLTKNSISHVKGLYVGGKVLSQQNGTQITAIKGTYHDIGPYITAAGGSGISSDYTKHFNFDVSKNKTFQKGTVSRTKYFNTYNAGSVDGKYTVNYKVGGSTYSIYVNASAKS